MKPLRHTLIVASLAAFALAAASPDSVKLSRKPKVGEKNRYEMKMVISTMGIDIDIEMINTEKVLKVNEDGSFVVEETQADMTVMVAGQPQPAQPDATGKLTYSKTGQIIEVEAEEQDADSLRTANLMAMMWPSEPVDVGSSWEVDSKGDGELGTIDISHKFKVVAREEVLGHDTFKISITAMEADAHGASGEGMVWIDIKNGMAVKATGKMQNVPAAGALMEEISYELKLIK